MAIDYARLKEKARERYISISNLCREVGKSVSYVDKAQKLGFTIPSDIIYRWAEILETTPEYLCGETDNPTIPAEIKEEDEMKVALFGGEKATDEEWEEVKKFVEYLKSKRENNER